MAEAALIIASILLAFAIDASWDARGERNEADATLLNLHDEFSHNRPLLLSHLARINLTVLDSRRMSAWTEGAAPEIPTDSLVRALRSILQPPTLDLATGVVTEVIGSGRLNRIEDDALRAAIAGWPGRLTEGLDREPWEHVAVHEQLRPRINELVVFPPIRQGQRIDWFDREELHRSFETVVLRDVEFRSALGTRLDWAIASLRDKSQLLMDLDYCLELLEAELAERRLSPRSTTVRAAPPEYVQPR